MTAFAPPTLTTPDADRLPVGPSSTDIAVTLDLLVNGGLELVADDVFVFDGKRYRPVRWDLTSQTLICWQVA